MFKFFDPNFECFAKYDAFCSHIFSYACLRRKAYFYSYRREFEIIEELYASENIFENGWWEDAYPSYYPTPLDSPLAISYRNHQKSLAYFSHLTPLEYCSYLLKGRVKKGGGHGTMAPPPNMLLRAGFRQ